MKKTLLFVILIAIAIILFSLSKKDRGEGSLNENDSVNEEIVLENIDIKENNIFKNPLDEKYEESGDNYFVEIVYPIFGNSKIDREIKDFIISDFNLFKENNDLTFNNQSSKNSYDANYELTESKDYISIIFQIYEFTGGAHGNIRIKTLNYSKKGDRVYLGSLFKPESPYLEKLSEITRRKLKENFKDLDTAWIEDGTEAISSNFESFAITGADNNLKIIFQPYQVGPWVIGTPEILIDKKELEGVLN